MSGYAGAVGGARGGRSDPRGRDGWTLRAKSLHGPGDRPVHSAGDAAAPRDTSDDLGSGLLSRGLCRGRLRFVSRALGGTTTMVTPGARGQGSGQAGRGAPPAAP